jgi:hypothetical protein
VRDPTGRYRQLQYEFSQRLLLRQRAQRSLPHGRQRDGVCKSPLEAGLETTDPGTIAISFAKTTLGAGAAMFLAQCLDDACGSCFQP